MKEPYLEITFRRGRALAAYYHLPCRPEATVAHTRSFKHGLVVDYTGSGEPLGVEITAPSRVSLEAFNALLAELGVAPLDAAEFAPLHAA